jgi:hypothetical protein
VSRLFIAVERTAKAGSVTAFLWMALAGTVSAGARPDADPASSVAATDLRASDSSFELPILPVSRGPALQLLWFDPSHALEAPTTSAVADEVREIFRGLGVEVAFRAADAAANYGDGPLPEIPVILLNDDPVVARRPSCVLGLVMRHQEPRRAVWAFLENVRWTLSHDQDRRRPAMGEEIALGRALGRVVAHEVIHSLAPDEPHSKNGLMGHSMNRAFLLSDKPPLEARCGRAFLTALATLTPRLPVAAQKASLASVR